MRGEYDAHAGLKAGIRRNPAPRPDKWSLPVVKVAKWVAVIIAVMIVLEVVIL